MFPRKKKKKLKNDSKTEKYMMITKVQKYLYRNIQIF